MNANRMEESRNSVRATQKFLGCEKSHAKTVAWSYDMERSCDKMRGKILRIRRLSNLTTINSNKEELEMVENCQKYGI